VRSFLLVLLVALAGPVALAQEAPSLDLAEEADLHFGIAVRHYRSGDYRTALEHLLLSNRLVPNRNVVFNIARAYEELGEYDQAFRHYTDYLALEDDPEMRASGERSIEGIRSRVALVQIDTEPAGATIYVDRRNLGPRGVTPRTLALDPGEHELFLELEGYRPGTATTTVTVGETSEVTTSLEQILGEIRIAGSPEGAEVHFGTPDDPVVATVPATIAAPPGNRVLVVTAPSHQVHRTVVEVVAEQTTDVVVDLAILTGAVVVDALEHDALIEIDDQPAGFTPAVLEVPVGQHEVRVSRQGFRPHEETILVEDDQRTILKVRLRSQQEVTAATRTTKAVEEAPASVSVITRQEIRAFGYTSVWDALSNTRGVYATDDLTYRYLGFRGFGRPGDYGNRVLVTMDGHTLNDDQLGASYVAEDLSSDLGDVEQIEVVRGPGSALYGTNAFFGVVNVVTRDRASLPDPHVSVTSEGLRMSRARAGLGLGAQDRGGWLSLAAFAGQGDDYYFEEWDTPEDGDGRSVDSDVSYGGTFHGKAWAGDVTFQVFFNARRKHVPTGAFDTLLADPRSTTNDFRSFAELRWEPFLGEKARLYSRVYADVYNYFGDYPYRPRYVASDRWSGAWAGFEPRVVTSPAPWLELTAGGEARFHYQATLYSFDTVRGEIDEYLDEKPIQQVYSGYALAELRHRQLFRASLGARYDYFTLEDVGGALSPRAALIWTPGDSDVLKLVAGTAFRAPSPYELFYNDDGFTQVRPESLDPERIYTAEVEYTHRFDEVTTLTGATYYNQITNLVDTELTGIMGEEGELFRYANTADPTATVGVEWEVRRAWRGGAMFALNHSMQRTRVGSLLDGDEFTNSPEHLIGLKAATPLVPGIAIAATRLRAESPRLTVYDTHTHWALLWDVTLTGDLPTAPVSYGLGVRNLLDWKYDHPGGFELRMPAVPQPGRTAYARLEARF
jgi:outer membrane receptor protein involved in Fe transport